MAWFVVFHSHRDVRPRFVNQNIMLDQQAYDKRLAHLVGHDVSVV
jgi:hypothetical protein